jgi:hypothetical protein
MGGVSACRIWVGPKSQLLQRIAAALSVSVVAMSLSACQAPANLASSAFKAQPHPPAPASSPSALAMLSKSDTQLVGLDDHDLTAALGEPNHIRHDDPATIWQYTADNCVVDFYMYQADAGLQVAYVEARDHKAQTEVTQACMHALLQPNVAGVTKTADATN